MPRNYYIKNMKTKLLTKSRFKLGLTCPTQLYYNDNPEYENLNNQDSFLKALAEGGYQVGELAKAYHPEGIEVHARNYEESVQETKQHLNTTNRMIFEAAVRWENCFVRIDILKKHGDTLDIIEVKAKSADSLKGPGFLNKSGNLSPDWNEYLQDVAFQFYVTQKAFPQFKVRAFLMLADKSKRASVNGLNQKFMIHKSKDGKIQVRKEEGLNPDTLGNAILSTFEVTHLTEKIIMDELQKVAPAIPYANKIKQWSDAVTQNKKITATPGKHCFQCPFQTEDNNTTKRSGFKECWMQHYGLSEIDLTKPLIREIWNYGKKQDLLDAGIVFMEDVTADMLGIINAQPSGKLSTKDRQWIQVEKVRNKDNTPYLDIMGLQTKMNTFQYPLHFIDFETSMVAIPFYTGQRPYETIAFQFSHHILYSDGRAEHKDEYIKIQPGEFPNFEFVRALKQALDKDNGTIFRYAAHENTVLNHIALQLAESDVSDKDELIEFIETITENNSEGRVGIRSMVDMCQMVKDYYFDPATRGSNSIKAVLPAVINRSKYIKEKYSKPIYGKNGMIRSQNFEDNWVWIQYNEDGIVKDPYQLLPGIFEEINQEERAQFLTENELNNGGAAMTAFAKIQFTHMSEAERNRVLAGLLKYCELDTLAMLMIYEYFQAEVEGRE